MIFYVTGGARSGKSAYAEKIAKRYQSVGYIATAVVTDEEMEHRIALHKQSRPKHWVTFEQHKNIADVIEKNDCEIFLLDCLTVLVTNYIMEYSIDGQDLTCEIETKIEKAVLDDVSCFINTAKKQDKNLIIVSNETGMGIVPMHRLSRAFRDIQGRANQLCAKLCDEAYFMVSSLPMKLK